MQMYGNFQGFLLDHAFFGLVILTLVWGKIAIFEEEDSHSFWGRVPFF